MNKINDITKDDLNTDLPQFRAGDTISIGVKVIEGETSRIQQFEGTVIAISSGSGTSKTFTVRKYERKETSLPKRTGGSTSSFALPAGSQRPFRLDGPPLQYYPAHQPHYFPYRQYRPQKTKRTIYCSMKKRKVDETQSLL